MEIIHIVPELPPMVNGVGDYSLTLAQNLSATHGIETIFVVCNPANASEGSIGHLRRFEVVVLPRRSRRALMDVVQSFGTHRPLLLQYVQYGYARRGCPIWLERGLHYLCKDGRRPLVTMFHELYAPGHFPDSAFWLSPLQKHLARSIARLSCACATSRAIYAEELSAWSIAKVPVQNLPIPSGVGESPADDRFQARQKQMVVFGLSSTRLRAYRDFRQKLASACRALEIERIVDIGPLVSDLPMAVEGVPVVVRGPLPAVEVGQILVNSVAGFLAYDLAYLGRSSVFAAYCAHGVAPLCVHNHRKAEVTLQDGLRSSVHFRDAARETGPLNLSVAEELAKHAGTWYRMHDQATHATHFARLLQKQGGT